MCSQDDSQPLALTGTVVGVTPCAHATFFVTIHVPGVPPVGGGQFAMLSRPGSTAPLLPRPLSVFGYDPGRELLTFLIKVVGPGTRALVSLAVGAPVTVVAPLGTPYLPPEGSRLLLAAGGTGLAPCAMLLEHPSTPMTTTLVYGAKTATYLVALGRVDDDIVYCTDDGSHGREGMVPDLVDELLAEGRHDAVFTCGPEGMMRAVAAVAASHGVPCSVSLERVMACGFGVCLGCVVPLARGGYARVCTEGPVFDAGAVFFDVPPDTGE